MKRIGLGLGLCLAFHGLFLLSASGRVNRIADEFEVYLQVESLWDRGSLAIPQVHPRVFFGKKGRDGAQYAPYGPGLAFLAVPHHALARASAVVLGLPAPVQDSPHAQIVAWKEWVCAITSLASATWAALAVLGLFRLSLLLGASPGRAALSAALLGGASVLWPYGTVFFSEAAAGAALIWAVVFWLEKRPLLAEAMAVVLFLIKTTNLVFWPALILLAAGATRPASLRDLIKRTQPFLLAGIWALAIHLSWNLYRFNNALDFGYAWTEYLGPGATAPKAFLLARLPRGLFGLLLSPGKSIFLFVPPLVLACARLPALRREHPALFHAWCAAAAASLIVFGSFFHWEGGYCFGPRQLIPLVPLLLAPLALGPSPRRAALAAVILIGVTVQVLGVLVSFKEDQAEGIQNRPPQSRYYEFTDDPNASWRISYRMDYSPLASYPPIVKKHLQGEPGSGSTGLDLLPLHLLRVRNGGAPIPAVGIALVPLLGLVLLLLGTWVVVDRLRAPPPTLAPETN